MDTILKSENITKSYHKTKQGKIEVLKNVSLSIEPNKITVIVGASGAGKSTLLHILSGLDIPDSGKVIVKETEISTLKDKELSKFRNKNIGFIFQFHHLLPEFTALENAIMPMLIDGVTYSKAEKRGLELLKNLGLENRIDHKPAELSGGEQQRVAVARAMANNPDIIFADEPTGNLDTANSEIMHQIFNDLKLKEKKTLLIVTHNPNLVSIADTVIEMKDGIIISSTNNTN
mgnify:FL=1